MVRKAKAPAKKPRKKKEPPLIDTLPAMLVSAIAGGNDFILTFETDEYTGSRTIHAMTGQFVSTCMLRKLVGQAESQKDEGGVLISRPWKPVPGDPGMSDIR